MIETISTFTTTSHILSYCVLIAAISGMHLYVLKDFTKKVKEHHKELFQHMGLPLTKLEALNQTKLYLLARKHDEISCEQSKAYARKTRSTILFMHYTMSMFVIILIAAIVIRIFS